MYKGLSRSLLALFWVVLLLFLGTAFAEGPRYVVGIVDGQRMRLLDNRQPALYTADYGDCLGESAINVTRFDAAYYKDNMTIIFHLEGETALTKEAIMMNIGVYAYGESRFYLTFNPCSANIRSACPVKAGTRIEAEGIIPINQDDVAGIPELALSIPDFEGQAILRIFSNSTQTEIGCFAAQITNGYTFQQKASVSSTLGAFTLLAVLSSFATAVYGDHISVIRKHYAHSLSVLVVFAVWHHIFYSGALSLNWPSVLVAFWSNYAWAGGMVYSEHMQNTINKFIGSNKGNTSQVGAAGTGVANPGLGEGIDIQQIYKRGVLPEAVSIQDMLAKRHLVDASSGFSYYGQPVKPGLPLPGNYSGFAGTLAQERIPASNAFMTGLLWFLILIACVAVFMIAFKIMLEGLSRAKLVKVDRFTIFRAHYLFYTAVGLLRLLFIGFYVISFLAMFQFSYLASPGPVAVACVVFIGVVFGLGSVAAFACYSRINFAEYVSEPDRLNVEKRMVLKFVPWYRITRESRTPRSEDKVYAGSIQWWTLHPMADAKSIHDDETFAKHFGWLASRYRRTRWWFFVVWLAYEFVRACFLAGASSQPMIQVFGLLVVEFIAFVAMIFLRPFEGQRLNTICVYLLGASKITTVALSAAFDRRFNLPRIPATVIGIVIIVIQGTLTLIVLTAIVVGAITSYMSVMRNREEIKPGRWKPMREKYFKEMDFKTQDIPKPQPAPVQSMPEMPEIPKSPYFNVRHVRRVAKVEDEDDQFMQEISNNPSVSQLSVPGQTRFGVEKLPSQRSRAVSLQSQTSHSSLPRTARLHRANWSTQNHGDPQGPRRRRATSNTTDSTPGGPHRPNSRVRPRLNTNLGSGLSIDRQPSPHSITASRTDTPEASSVSQLYGDTDAVSPTGRAVSRLTSRSQSSSRPNPETRISEEVPPLPEKSGA